MLVIGYRIAAREVKSRLRLRCVIQIQRVIDEPAQDRPIIHQVFHCLDACKPRFGFDLRVEEINSSSLSIDAGWLNYIDSPFLIDSTRHRCQPVLICLIHQKYYNNNILSLWRIWEDGWPHASGECLPDIVAHVDHQARATCPGTWTRPGCRSRLARCTATSSRRLVA